CSSDRLPQVQGAVAAMRLAPDGTGESCRPAGSVEVPRGSSEAHRTGPHGTFACTQDSLGEGPCGRCGEHSGESGAALRRRVGEGTWPARTRAVVLCAIEAPRGFGGNAVVG